jgi:hypothetical protein
MNTKFEPTCTITLEEYLDLKSIQACLIEINNITEELEVKSSVIMAPFHGDSRLVRSIKLKGSDVPLHVAEEKLADIVLKIKKLRKKII